jgi:hypothetical protein
MLTTNNTCKPSIALSLNANSTNQAQNRAPHACAVLHVDEVNLGKDCGEDLGFVLGRAWCKEVSERDSTLPVYRAQ